MISIERGQQLHGRACRGEKLTESERADLDAWYTEMDAAEAEQLSRATQGPSLSELQAQLDDELRQLSQVESETKAIRTTNEALRREIATLKRRLAGKQPQAVR